jgi:hypothetical protein
LGYEGKQVSRLFAVAVGTDADGNTSGYCTPLVTQKNKVSAAANAEFCKQIRNVELHRPFGYMQPVGNFLVREIFQQAAKDFLFAPTKIGWRVIAEPPALRSGQDGVYKPRKNRARNPKSAFCDQRQRSR